MSGLLSNGLVQTALVFAAPVLVPKGYHLLQRFLNPQPAGKRTALHPSLARPPPPRDVPRYAALRLFVFALGISVALFTALNPPHNLFLLLSPPLSLLQQLFPLLRQPLDLRLATETLARLWSTHLGRPLSDDELALAQRLQTLDARLSYIAYGAGPLMGCEWCRPPGSTDGSAGSTLGLVGTDYILALLPGIAVAYLSVLAAAGVMLSGNGRKRYRKWAVGATVAAGVYEMYRRVSWDGARGGIGQTVTMLHTTLHLHRSLFALFLLTISFLAPPHSPAAQPSSAALVAPALASLAAQTEAVLHRLRALSVLRMAVLHRDEYREQVTSFWRSAARESALARKDPNVRDLLRTQVAPAVEPFRAWVEGAMRAPGVVEEEEEEREGEEGEREKNGEQEEDGEREKAIDGKEEEEEVEEEPPLTA
ncbi:hypothetical protein JCM10207_005371 [Rhodosporidiobolus poonsookiae]